ncbi:MAG: insulinase family protein [Betaproteobacteria bacterium]|nr:insulinase family protein [Betaproteobacteria bacterium]
MNTLKKIAIKPILAWVGLVFCMESAMAGIPIERWVQASGAEVYLVPSQAIPMLDVQIDFDAGSRRDPPTQAGLAGIMAAMSAKGVLAGGPAEPALDENALSEAWADLGASFGGGAGADRFSFSLRTLSYPDLLARAAALAARQMGQPTFPDAVWQNERERLKASLREANTRPATLAARAFSRAVYGSHPYGQEMTEATLSAISVTDMQSLQRTLLPCRARVTLVGAVTRPQADELVHTLLARLPPGPPGACPPLALLPEVAALTQPSEQIIAFDSAQAQVLFGQPGVTRADPDYFALTVGNYVLGGGGFVSRLTTEVREKRGLTYSVYSYFAPGIHAGAFTVGLQTRSDQAAAALQLARDVVARFVTEGPTEAELRAAKDNLVGGFALRIDTNRKLLDNVANIAAHRLPLDYLDGWTDQVEQVTVAQVRAAFERKLQPATMATVVLGATGPTAP